MVKGIVVVSVIVCLIGIGTLKSVESPKGVLNPEESPTSSDSSRFSSPSTRSGRRRRDGASPRTSFEGKKPDSTRSTSEPSEGSGENVAEQSDDGNLEDEWWKEEKLSCPIFGNGSTFKPFYYRYCVYGLEVAYGHAKSVSVGEVRSTNRVHFTLVYNAFDGRGVKFPRAMGMLKAVCSRDTLENGFISFGKEIVFRASGTKKEEFGVDLFFACCIECDVLNKTAKELMIYLGRMYMAFEEQSVSYHEDLYATFSNKVDFRDSFKYSRHFRRLRGAIFPSLGVFTSTDSAGMEAPTCYDSNFFLINMPLGMYVCSMLIEIPLKGVVADIKLGANETHPDNRKNLVYLGHGSVIPRTFDFECAERPPQVPNQSRKMYCWDTVGTIVATRCCCTYGENARFLQAELAFRLASEEDYLTVSSHCLDYKYNFPEDRRDWSFTFDKALNDLLDTDTPLLRRRFTSHKLADSERLRYCPTEIVSMQRGEAGNYSIGLVARAWKAKTHANASSGKDRKHEHCLYDSTYHAGEDLEGSLGCQALVVESEILRRITPMACFYTKPNKAGCLDDDFRNSSSNTLLCCCTGDFCNVRGNLLLLAHYNPKPLCKYNNLYQHLINRYLKRDHNTTNYDDHSCFIHFHRNFKEKSGLWNIVPGSNYYPTQYAYENIPVNTCAYVELSQNARYKNRHHCADKTFAKYVSPLLPLMVIACHCQTKDGDRKPCDEVIVENFNVLAMDRLRAVLTSGRSLSKEVRALLCT